MNSPNHLQSDPTISSPRLEEWTPDRRIAILQSEAKTPEAELAQEHAWSSIYQEFAPKLAHYSEIICKNHAMAEDVTQDVFVRAFRNINKFVEEGPHSLERWLTVITRNRTMDHLRGAEHKHAFSSDFEADILPEQSSASSTDPFENAAFKDSLRRLETGLRPSQYSALLLSVFGLTPPENAIQHSTTEPSIHGLIHRGRRAAQKILREAS